MKPEALLLKTGGREIVGITDTSETTCTGVEMFENHVNEGRAGENCGVLLRGIERDAVERGGILSKPSSITPHTEFEAGNICAFKGRGGRHTHFW